jgi:hypothetical protein
VLIGMTGLALACAACVGPARDFPTFERKAVETAEAVIAAVENARLTAGAAAEGKTFPPYAAVVLGESEEGASAAAAAFASIQPPDERSDALRRELAELLSAAVSYLEELRVAGRRAELRALEPLAAPLAGISDRLDAFVETHS